MCAWGFYLNDPPPRHNPQSRASSGVPTASHLATRTPRCLTRRWAGRNPVASWRRPESPVRGHTPDIRVKLAAPMAAGNKTTGVARWSGQEIYSGDDYVATSSAVSPLCATGKRYRRRLAAAGGVT